MNYKALVENQAECKIKILRTDNGHKYCGFEFTKQVQEAGTKREFTVSHILQQNVINQISLI